jgi:hypothetical protein
MTQMRVVLRYGGVTVPRAGRAFPPGPPDAGADPAVAVSALRCRDVRCVFADRARYPCCKAGG